jgi:hypothetical protein
MSPSRTSVTFYVVLSFLLGCQVRMIYDVLRVTTTTIDNFSGVIETIKDVDFNNQLTTVYQNSSLQLLQLKPRPVFSKDPSTCERRWDWPFLGTWTQSFVLNEKQNITTFQVSRSNAHETARGTIRMELIIPLDQKQTATKSEQRRVVVYVAHQDAMGANAWHRIAVQYMVWIAWQVAQHRMNEFWSTHVEIALPCSDVNDIPQGWRDLVFSSQKTDRGDRDNSLLIIAKATFWCTNDWKPRTSDDLIRGLKPLLEKVYSDSTIDSILVPPNDGLLWDLAWDTSFQCTESHMFRTFMQQFAQSSDQSGQNSLQGKNGENRQILSPKATIPSSTVVCWILRYGNPQRDISNRDDVHGMLLSIFDTVRLIHITRYHTSVHIRNVMFDCQVLYGVHGAGMVNAMWGTLAFQEKTAVVEVLPNNQPQYFRSVSALVGHFYESIPSDHSMEHSKYHVNLAASSAALRRARDHIQSVAQ